MAYKNLNKSRSLSLSLLNWLEQKWLNNLGINLANFLKFNYQVSRNSSWKFENFSIICLMFSPMVENTPNSLTGFDRSLNINLFDTFAKI